MAIIEIKDGSAQTAIQELLRSMLERGLVSAVLVPQETPSQKTVVQTLVRDPAKLAAVNPLAPVFGVNSARIITSMCACQMASPFGEALTEEEEVAAEEAQDSTSGDEEGKTTEETTAQPAAASAAEQATVATQPDVAPIAVVLRPCEIRAFVELVKLQQAQIDPFLVIGVDCWGTYSVTDYEAKVAAGARDGLVTADFLEQVTSGNLPEELRGACRVCRYPAPTYADISIHLIGEDPRKQIRVQPSTDKGKAICDALELEATPDSDQRESALAAIKDARKQLAEQDKLDFLELISSRCINCRNCRAVCPICYCKQCVFDGDVFAYPLEKYLSWAGKRGALGMPPDRVLFHLTRMSHVASSCAACGQCEAACPNNIPLGRIYQRISAAAQEALGYEAGRSLDDELPLTTFREDELSVVES